MVKYELSGESWSSKGWRRIFPDPPVERPLMQFKFMITPESLGRAHIATPSGVSLSVGKDGRLIMKKGATVTATSLAPIPVNTWVKVTASQDSVTWRAAEHG